MAAESVELLHSIFTEGGYPPLRLIHFHNNMAGDGGARAMASIIASSPRLEDFRFSATRAGSEGCRALASAMANLTNLRYVDLADGNFSKEAGADLCLSLPQLVT